MAKARGKVAKREDLDQVAGQLLAEAQAQLGTAGFEAYGNVLGIRGLAARRQLLNTAAGIDEESYRAALLEGFASEAAIAELQAELGNRTPPFAPDELEAIRERQDGILRQLRKELSRSVSRAPRAAGRSALPTSQ